MHCLVRTGATWKSTVEERRFERRVRHSQERALAPGLGQRGESIPEYYMLTASSAFCIRSSPANPDFSYSAQRP